MLALEVMVLEEVLELGIVRGVNVFVVHVLIGLFRYAQGIHE